MNVRDALLFIDLMTPPTLLDDSQVSDAILLGIKKDIAAARTQINSAFQATMVVGGFSTLIWWVQITRGVPDSSWGILDLILIFGLGYGIRKNSNICAILMFGYYLLSKLYQIFSGQFPPTAAPLAGIIFYYLWQGILGTSRYTMLLESEATLNKQQQSVDTSQASSPAPSKPKPVPPQPLTLSPELISLCGGDRAQAQWLLSQIRSKHPDRSPGWCERQAIAQLTAKAAVETNADE
ncbi:hypothetical protein [Chamaesiphon sp. GL140_3_metabinner_50]|uniref:hypothetical protein n=1 Tax=Chamaesiphon sp. GL140_3_metabinner_50 TaxID=2970812 RepID=UPI0025FE89F6|nr:hypothetical protein [Chamaesiphon sp. GL140_3_metabinner_50]